MSITSAAALLGLQPCSIYRNPGQPLRAVADQPLPLHLTLLHAAALYDEDLPPITPYVAWSAGSIKQQWSAYVGQDGTQEG